MACATPANTRTSATTADTKTRPGEVNIMHPPIERDVLCRDRSPVEARPSPETAAYSATSLNVALAVDQSFSGNNLQSSMNGRSCQWGRRTLACIGFGTRFVVV